MLRSLHAPRQPLIGRLGVGLALMALFSGAALLSAPKVDPRSAAEERSSS